MSDIFRELLQKIGSGIHTGKNLSRKEAKLAMKLMLEQQATPAQIGAFFIAHRIKRPTADELAGMLDSYEQFGPQLTLTDEFASPTPVILGTPYDGRSRTAPITPLTALLLAAAGVPTILHGGKCMPTKYGMPLIDIWRAWGVDFSRLSRAAIQQLFKQTNWGFFYLPRHFTLAERLVPYREQIGKRPPLATLELIWSPYQGTAHVMTGFVHPPTETTARATLAARGTNQLTTIKGLEGSCDLPRSRTGIVGWMHGREFERIYVHPREYGLAGSDVPQISVDQTNEQLTAILNNQPSELLPAAILNGGFYLWHIGVCSDLSAGLEQAERMFQQGQVMAKWQEIVHVFHRLLREQQADDSIPPGQNSTLSATPLKMG